MSLLLPPRVELVWTASALGTDFDSYRIYRRPSRTPALPWSPIAVIDVPSGYGIANTEAQHNAFIDYEPGWTLAGGQWASGWDYAVTVMAASTGFESAVALDTANPITPDSGYWAVSNLSPYLNFPLASVDGWQSQDDQSLFWQSRAAGRDLAIVRTASELPARTLSLTYRDFVRLGEDGIRTWRAAASLGAVMTLHSVRGDRSIGGLQPPSSGRHDETGVVTWQGSHVETYRDPIYRVAGYNLPAGMVFNGSSRYIRVTNNALLNPGSGDFTVMVYAAPANVQPRYMLTKGNIGTADGYGIGTVTGQSNSMRFTVDGATAAATPQEINAAWFDGAPHVAIGAHASGSQSFYRDGILVASSAVVTGAVTNAIDLLIGANNGGGVTNYQALAPFIAAAYWPRKLTPDEVLAATGYVLGYPNTRLPAGANFFLDLRDDRSWSGVGGVVDLSGNGLVCTPTSGPITRGVPWPLSLVDRF